MRLNKLGRMITQTRSVACSMFVSFAMALTAAYVAQPMAPAWAEDPAAAPPVEAATEHKAEEKKVEPTKNKAKTEVAKPAGKATSAVLKTTAGDITVKLFPDKAPKTVENFAGLATGKKTWGDPKTGKEMKGKPLYNGTIFHRVIPDFMIQGGDVLGDGTGSPKGPGFPFEDEVSPSDSFDRPYILAMANAGPNTNGSQFFITVKPTPWLNGKHTIFGEVTKGQKVVDQIVSAAKGPNDRPEKPVSIKSIAIK